MVEGVELNVTNENKEKLRCFVCGGYLLCSPIQMLPDGNNLCGRCSPGHKATTYRNHVLEAILKDAVFPCKFKVKGCLKQLNFISDSDHESTCTYSETSSQVAVKSSASTCAQEEIPTCSTKDPNVFVVPKPGSVAMDESAGGSDWNDNSDRNASAPPSTTNSTHNYNTHRERASSVASNRSQRLNWSERQRNSSRSRPYYNYVDNRNQWRSPWLHDRPAEHFNMYKRRNNLIIIKGGTFYVNW
ncbi:hypothetical protein RN001_014154 [Aquatica leii]|uniref:Uncharacterized protein n=1 Tax=Aquatica leii TaxID=1421715 RepID=A0AAN7P170_9COLE|nr:hypothetical protein RN001_014154 [Aquatica leii]